ADLQYPGDEHCRYIGATDWKGLLVRRACGEYLRCAGPVRYHQRRVASYHDNLSITTFTWGTTPSRTRASRAASSSWASATARAVTFTISATSLDWWRTHTGRLIPTRMGPT